MTDLSIPAYNLPVYPAETFRVQNGANLGDPLSYCEELILDDIYALQSGAVPRQLGFAISEDAHFAVAADSKIGQPGAPLHLDSALTLMSPDGLTTDAVVLVETDAQGGITQIYLLPLSALSSDTTYALVGLERDTAAAKLAQLGCARFSKGTHITLHSGEQRAIEDLRVGDLILTRDDGPQELRWIGQSTVRAMGDFAPIRIRAGALNNSGDLFVSPDHRLFLFQRQDQLGTGRSELLVKARDLVNADSISVQAGGYIDYFQLLFDHHQIIYAEGIAAESMLVDMRAPIVNQ